MTNKDITKIYFRGNEIVALYRGDTLIFKKSGSVVPPSPKPTGVYTVRGTLKPNSREQNIQLCVNGQREQFDVNNDKTFEYTFVNVPVTNMDYFTLQCKGELKTLDLSSLDTSQVTSMIEAFFQCNLSSIVLTNVDTSNVTDMRSMFDGCTNLKSLDVSNFDVSNVTDMSNMFIGCSGLTSLDLSSFDTSNVTDMKSMFEQCDLLETLDLSSFDTSQVTNMGWMFYSCDNLTNLYVNFNTNNVKVLTNIFYYSYKLTNVVGKFEGAKYYLDLSYSPLTAASAMVFINGLATVTEQRTLSLSRTTYDSLTNGQIAIATSKGWTVTRN